MIAEVSDVSAAGTKTLWEIGTSDNLTGEFAQAPGNYRGYRRPGFFVVGQSDPKRDWPYVVPGPSDGGWAQAGPNTFGILFGLRAVPAKACRLVLDFVDTHSVRPPKLRIEINGQVWEHQTPRGGSDKSVFGDLTLAREHTVHIDVPPTALQAGNNWIAITSSQGSWALWDAVRLEAPSDAMLDDAHSMISTVRSEPALVRDGNQMKQPVTIGVLLAKEAASPALVRVDGATSQVVPAAKGQHVIEMLLPPVAANTRETVRLVMNERVVDEKSFERQPVRKWEIHLLHQTHLDVGYTHTQKEVLQRQVRFLHTALELIRETKDYPEDARFKWHPEGMWAIDEFLRTATADERAEFLEAIRRGSIHLDGFYVHMLTGLGTEEELLHLMQPAKDFETKYGVKVTTAIGSDVPGYTWGLVSAMGQQGLKYLNMAPNNNHRLGYVYLLGNKPFYWTDPSGDHKVLCWMVPNSYIHFWGGRNRDVGAAVLQFIDHYLVAKDYPYDIAQIRYSIGGDNGHPDSDLARQVKAWNEKYAFPRIILSTNTRLFAEFEQRYGQDLPTLAGDLTPYWEDGAASTAADLAIHRHAKNDLDQAERLWAMVAPEEKLHDPFGQAWHNAIMYDEHTWGAHCSISKPFSEFTISQEKFKQQFAHATRDIAATILNRVTAGIQAPGSKTIDLYNTASWDRSGMVLLPSSMSSFGDRLIDTEGNDVPTQRLGSGELAVSVPRVPAFGAKRLQQTSEKATYRGDVLAKGNILENSKIKIVIDPANGAIASLFSKILDKELVDSTQGRGLNDYLYTIGRATGENYSRITSPVDTSVEDEGPVVGTPRVASDAPGCSQLVRRVRIYHDSERIDLINDMDKVQELQPESAYFVFPFNIPEGQPRIDTPYAVVRPEQDQLPGANRNYYCVQRWVDVSNADFGVTWITHDAPMLKFHPFKIIGRGRGCLPVASMMYDKTPDGVPEFWDCKIAPTSFFYFSDPT
ncbi:MAG: polysaccharide lyase family protein [Pirellulaceae bacterium]